MGKKVRANERTISSLSNEELKTGTFRRRAKNKIVEEIRKRGLENVATPRYQ